MTPPPARPTPTPQTAGDTATTPTTPAPGTPPDPPRRITSPQHLPAQNTPTTTSHRPARPAAAADPTGTRTHPTDTTPPSAPSATARPARRSHRRAATLRRRTPPALTAITGGALLYLATPPVGCWPLAPLAVTLLTLTVRGRRLRASYGLGVLFGLAFCIPLLRFVSFVGIDAWAALAIAEAAILALVAPATTLVWRLPGAWIWTAAVWTAQEALRDRAPFGGFPWGRLAFTQSDSPLTGLAALGGAPLLTATVAALGALGTLTVLRTTSVLRTTTHHTTTTPHTSTPHDSTEPAPAHPTPTPTSPTTLARRLTAPLLGLTTLTLAGLAVPLPTTAQNGTLNVAAIQGNVPADGGIHALGRAFQVTANHLTETRNLAAAVAAGHQPHPDLVLWPENSSDLDPLTNPAVAAALRNAATTVGAPLLVGAVLDGPGPGHVRNAGMIWTSHGFTGQMYVKRHPVPFAEYLPGRKILTKLISRFADDMPADFLAGTTPGALHTAGTTIGDVICFEVAYDNLVRDTIDHGAQILVIQTNNASFGRKGESQQQLAMSRLRAVEHGRATIQVSTSGQSALIAPDGTILAHTGLYQAGHLTAALPRRTSRTLADRTGPAPEAVLVALAAGAMMATMIHGRRTRRATHRTPGDHPNHTPHPDQPDAAPHPHHDDTTPPAATPTTPPATTTQNNPATVVPPPPAAPSDPPAPPSTP